MSDTGRAGRRGGISRRQFAGTIAAGLAALGGGRPAGAAAYRVARINAGDPYAGAIAAMTASGEFPDVAGRTVIVKPNLVAKRSAQTGITTDPEVVRAVVDHALGADAASVKIVEGGLRGANFADCGYSFFSTYDPRVELRDLSLEPQTFVTVPASSPPAGSAGAPAAYQGLYLPSIVLDPGVVFVSVPKMKTHAEAMATLSIKNLYGLPPCPPYFDPARESFLPRYSMHTRSLGQTIASLALARPIDFAVVDGVWALEGSGPVDITGGTPVQANVVVAGKNALAVDLACLDVMGIARDDVQHVEYAYLAGLGPRDLSEIDLAGDPIDVAPFLQPVVPPRVWAPRISPLSFSPARGERCTISYRLTEPAQVQVQVLRTSDRKPAQTVVRTLQPWTDTEAGSYSLQWDGRDDTSVIVAPSLHGVRVQARRLPTDAIVAAGINWTVVAV